MLDASVIRYCCDRAVFPVQDRGSCSIAKRDSNTENVAGSELAADLQTVAGSAKAKATLGLSGAF